MYTTNKNLCQEIDVNPIMCACCMVNNAVFGPVRLGPTMVDLCGECFDYYQPIIENEKKIEMQMEEQCSQELLNNKSIDPKRYRCKLCYSKYSTLSFRQEDNTYWCSNCFNLLNVDQLIVFPSSGEQCGHNVGTSANLNIRNGQKLLEEAAKAYNEKFLKALTTPIYSSLKETFPKKNIPFPHPDKTVKAVTGPKCTCGSAAVKSPTHSDWCDINTQLAPKRDHFGNEIDWGDTFTDFMMSDPDKTQPLKKP